MRAQIICKFVEAALGKELKDVVLESFEDNASLLEDKELYDKPNAEIA